MTKTTFDQIGTTLTVRADVREMDMHSKINLFNYLADHLGITKAAQDRPDESYQVLWGEMIDEHW